MSRVGWILIGGAWSAAVFGGVFWYTFPSDELGQRLAHQVHKATQGRWTLQVDGAAPWWLGVQGDNVILSKRADDGTLEPRFFAEEVRFRVGATSLLRKAPALTGQIALGGGTLDLFVRTVLPTMDVRVLQVRGDGVDLGDLLALLPGGGGGVGLSGRVDLAVDLQLPEGAGKADGKVELVGEGLTLDTITVESLGWIDKEIGATVDTVDFRLDLDDGRGKITDGVLATSLADLEVRGALELADDLGRSRLDVELTLALADWTGTPLESMRGIVGAQLAAATHADGKARFAIDSTLGRLDAGDLRPVRDRSARPSRLTPPSADAADPGTASPYSRVPPSAGAPVRPAEDSRDRFSSRLRGYEGDDRDLPADDDELDELEEIGDDELDDGDFEDEELLLDDEY